MRDRYTLRKQTFVNKWGLRAEIFFDKFSSDEIARAFAVTKVLPFRERTQANQIVEIRSIRRDTRRMVHRTIESTRSTLAG